MGYFKNQELEQVIEEPDRILKEPTGRLFEKPAEALLLRRDLRNRHRETYRAPEHWVVTNFDMALLWTTVPMSFILGLCVGILLSLTEVI